MFDIFTFILRLLVIVRKPLRATKFMSLVLSSIIAATEIGKCTNMEWSGDSPIWGNVIQDPLPEGLSDK